MKKRGRPRNADDPAIARQDALIAWAAYLLILWAFPARGPRGVFASVSRAAGKLPIGESGRQHAVGPDRVKQLYEAYLRRVEDDIERSEPILGIRTRSRVKRPEVAKRWLQSKRPLLLYDRAKGPIACRTVDDYAQALLRGCVPSLASFSAYSTEPDLTPSGARDTSAPTVRKRKRVNKIDSHA